MKYFPFRMFFISFFLPPVCYILTLYVLEGYFQKRQISKLNHLIIQNQEALYDGRYSVKEEINRNLGDYLSSSLMFGLGVSAQVLVKTRDDHILYPVHTGKDFMDSNMESSFSDLPTNSLNFMEVAAENYRILNEGLIVSVDVRIRHNSWLSNSILVIYVFLFVLILLRFIKKEVRETEKREAEQEGLIQMLYDQLIEGQSRLKEVKKKEAEYLKKIAELNKEKKDLSSDIDGVLEEMEELESGLKIQRELKEEMELEALELKEKLDRLQGKIERPKQKKKKAETTGKRFRVLYKNLSFTDRAIEGFLSLTDEFQLKGEEVIHKVNEDDSLLSVKRKVFGKGGKMNILEADFSYSGRIYFQKDSNAKIRIVAIGTKNTQEKDLAYMENI